MPKVLQTALFVLGMLIVGYGALAPDLKDPIGFTIHFSDFSVQVPDWLVLLIVTAVVVLIDFIIRKMKRVNREHPSSANGTN